jgi:hypothetical protein
MFRFLWVRSHFSYKDGTKDLEFYTPPTLGAGYSLAFGNIWLQWVSGGMYIGLRRILWNIQVYNPTLYIAPFLLFIQIDDLFLSTAVFEAETLAQSGNYRSTPDDIANLEYVSLMPPHLNRSRMI